MQIHAHPLPSCLPPWQNTHMHTLPCLAWLSCPLSPDPLGPSSAQIELGGMSTSTPSTALNTPLEVLKCFTMPRTCTRTAQHITARTAHIYVGTGEPLHIAPLPAAQTCKQLRWVLSTTAALLCVYSRLLPLLPMQQQAHPPHNAQPSGDNALQGRAVPTQQLLHNKP